MITAPRNKQPVPGRLQSGSDGGGEGVSARQGDNEHSRAGQPGASAAAAGHHEQAGQRAGGAGALRQQHQGACLACPCACLVQSSKLPLRGSLLLSVKKVSFISRLRVCGWSVEQHIAVVCPVSAKRMRSALPPSQAQGLSRSEGPCLHQQSQGLPASICDAPCSTSR